VQFGFDKSSILNISPLCIHTSLFRAFFFEITCKISNKTCHMQLLVFLLLPDQLQPPKPFNTADSRVGYVSGWTGRKFSLLRLSTQWITGIEPSPMLRVTYHHRRHHHHHHHHHIINVPNILILRSFKRFKTISHIFLYSLLLENCQT